jgi:general secretion pathway protein D
MRLFALLMVFLTLAGCGNLRPTPYPATSARDLLERQPPKTELKGLREYNTRIRGDRDAVTSMVETPPRADSGVLSEIDLTAATNSPAANRKKPAAGVTLEFFEPESLSTIIRVMLGDYLKVPYTIAAADEPKLAALKVKLFLQADGSRQELIEMFDAFLDAQGVKLRYTDGIYLVTLDEKARRAQPSPDGIGDVSAMIRLNYIEAKDFLPVARQLLREPDRGIIVSSHNSVVVNAAATEVRGLKRLAQEIDIPYFAGKFVIIYAPKYLSSKGLTSVIEQYLEQIGSTAARPNKQFEVKEIAEQERLVIVAANKSARDIVMDFINRVDIAAQNRRQLFQYGLSTQKSAEIAVTVNAVLKQMIKGTADIQAIPDKESNSLMIFATPDEYAEVRKIIAKLDYRPPAVHINIDIVDVSLNDALQYGVQWFLTNSGAGALADASVNLGQGIGGAAAAAAGVNVGIIALNSNRFFTLQLLANLTDLVMLSNPSLIVKNGYTARLSATREEPVISSKVPTGTQSGATTVISSQVEYKKIGLEVEVTPIIGMDGDVKLTLVLKDSSIVDSKRIDNNDYPVLSTREVKTEVVVQDGGTIFLGGLRRTRNNRAVTKIPVLGDFPGLIGAPFRNNNESSEMSELVVMLTPVIMLDQQGADIISRALVNAGAMGAAIRNAEVRDKLPGATPPLPREQ